MANFPNPFNPDTWIPYILAEASVVTIRIYDVQGHDVRSFSLGYQPAGWYDTRQSALHWDGRNADGEPVASGIYWVRWQAGQEVEIRRMMLRK